MYSAMTYEDYTRYELPDNPGVYYFLKDGAVMYVGKATSLKDRVRSYFSDDVIRTRGARIVKMVHEANSLRWKETQSVLEALLLEAEEIKKLQPPYNARDKDDKSFSYVLTTNEEYPRLRVVRGRNLEVKSELTAYKTRKVFGPFVSGSQLKEVLRIVRTLFPYRDTCTPLSGKACFHASLGLCPGVCIGKMSAREYRMRIGLIEKFFSGNTASVSKSLEKMMHTYAGKKEFEKANEIKKTLFSLHHIKDVALLKREEEKSPSSTVFRIEAYDIAHISGTSTVGVMTVCEDGELKKSDYRKFRIKGETKDRAHDIANLTEVLRRRFSHSEWELPSLIVVDGSVAQRNAAHSVLKEYSLDIPVVSVVKDERHKARDIEGDTKIIAQWKRTILRANSEAHRFAITYHREVRSRVFSFGHTRAHRKKS